MKKQVVMLTVRNSKTREVKQYPAECLMIGDYGVHRLVSDWDGNGGLKFGKYWTIVFPNGYCMGGFTSKKNALECTEYLKDMTTAAELVRINDLAKERRTIADIALVNSVIAVIRQYHPTPKGEL